MARDYAQRRRSTSKKRSGARRQATRPGTPGWVWMLLGVAIGVVAVSAFWIMRPPEQPAERAVVTPPRGERAREERIELPPEKPARFSFYEILPDYEVVIPRDEPAHPRDEPRPADTPPVEPPPLQAQEQYLIQVASFRSRPDAEEQRAQLALIGLEARIETVTIDDTQTWYRVRVGPFSDAARAHSAMVRLQENGHGEGMLVRVRN